MRQFFERLEKEAGIFNALACKIIFGKCPKKDDVSSRWSWTAESQKNVSQMMFFSKEL